jgi:hypothetical protein
MQVPDKCASTIHELWLIYCLLKDAETDLRAREELITSARVQLGRTVNTLNRDHSGRNDSVLDCRMQTIANGEEA